MSAYDYDDPERSPEEIEQLLDSAIEEPGKYPGMSYTEGIRNTIEWIFGITDDNPME